MEKKFIKVLESAMSRYTRGGFLVGDYVEFAKNYKTIKAFKALQDTQKDAIEELLKCGLRIRVIGIDDLIPARFPGNPDTSNGMVSIKIAADHGGGRQLYALTVCPSLLKVIDFYPNLAPFPDQFTRPNNEILVPKEVDKVDGGIEGGNYSLPTKNTPIKGTKKKSESYTVNYLAGIKS